MAAWKVIIGSRRFTKQVYQVVIETSSITGFSSRSQANLLRNLTRPVSRVFFIQAGVSSAIACGTCSSHWRPLSTGSIMNSPLRD